MYKIGFMFWCMLLGGCVALLVEGYKDPWLFIGLGLSIWRVVSMKDNLEIKKKSAKVK